MCLIGMHIRSVSFKDNWKFKKMIRGEIMDLVQIMNEISPYKELIEKIFNHFNENLWVFDGFSVYFELLLWIVPIFLLFPKSIDSRWICPYLAPNWTNSKGPENSARKDQSLGTPLNYTRPRRIYLIIILAKNSIKHRVNQFFPPLLQKSESVFL